jgi:signal transduction histidine kinase
VLIDPIHDEAGELVGFAKVTRDLTERWQAQQEIERAREAMAQAQKMEAVGRLTGGVAHDFNNLLTVIRASADLLRMPTLSEEKRRRYIEAISDTADRAATLTSQLLAFARRQPLNPEVFDVGTRILGMAQMIETSVGSAIAVTMDAGAGAVVNVDASQFETALLNLVVNARDAMPAGGRLAISCHIVEGLPPVRGHGAAEGPFVAVRVADSGGGIASDALKHIFEPFFTTKAINKGTGLGLSQVHGFAKQSGGEIDVQSGDGGTAFTLYLPRERIAAPPPEPSRVPDLRPIAARHVLLVEDNETVGDFARSLFEELGQHVTWVQNAEAALGVLEEVAHGIDLVFSDVIMPGMNGLDLARRIGVQWPGVRVVLTSGYSHVLAQDGGHGFELLRKPYSVEALRGVLGAGGVSQL